MWGDNGDNIVLICFVWWIQHKYKIWGTILVSNGNSSISLLNKAHKPKPKKKAAGKPSRAKMLGILQRCWETFCIVITHTGHMEFSRSPDGPIISFSICSHTPGVPRANVLEERIVLWYGIVLNLVDREYARSLHVIQIRKQEVPERLH